MSDTDLSLTEGECLHLLMMSTPERPLRMDWLTSGARLSPDCAWATEELKKIRSEA